MESLTIIRHGESVLNRLADAQQDNTLYQEFMAAYEAAPYDPNTQKIAREYMASMDVEMPDQEVPLSEHGVQQAHATGSVLQRQVALPDVVYVSPFARTQQTYQALSTAWPALQEVDYHIEDRLAERRRGIIDQFKSWKIFYSLHPEEALQRDQQGEYSYRFPEGESLVDVRDRVAELREEWDINHRGKHVMAVAHVGTIVALREIIERLSPEDVIDLHAHNRPANASLTYYARTAGTLSLQLYSDRPIT